MLREVQTPQVCSANGGIRAKLESALWSAVPHHPSFLVYETGFKSVIMGQL